MRVTGIPASRKHMAMPRPMVPPPTTPAALTALASFLASTPGTLAQARSAKNMCWSALASGDAASSTNFSCSTARPAAMSSACSMAASTHATMFFGAGSAAPASSLSRTSPFQPLTCTLRVLRTSACATSCSAFSSSSASGTTSSKAPSARACLAATGRPDTMSSRAASGPTRRGSRCVPPAPGNKPRCTSGSPTRAQALATR
mmetsp:Transcript_17468/g.52055  ORF Transcript_17468/g.52055 Transcript_17468/m.52055 type:complete len:203 (-) Transcript_17468:174-782(-)